MADEDAAQWASEASAGANERAGTTAELGPRSLALLRRAVLALELLAGIEVGVDPGRSFEDGPEPADED